MGKTMPRCSDFSLALDAAAKWRLEVLPAQSALTSTNVALEQQIFHSFIQLAAEQAFQHGNPIWASKAFEAVELNRASSLRESMALAGVWREKLPLEYWETLAKLGLGSLRTGSENRLLSRLTEMEAQAGLGLRAEESGEYSQPEFTYSFSGRIKRLRITPQL